MIANSTKRLFVLLQIDIFEINVLITSQCQHMSVSFACLVKTILIFHWDVFFSYWLFLVHSSGNSTLREMAKKFPRHAGVLGRIVMSRPQHSTSGQLCMTLESISYDKSLRFSSYETNYDSVYWIEEMHCHFHTMRSHYLFNNSAIYMFTALITKCSMYVV